MNEFIRNTPLNEQKSFQDWSKEYQERQTHFEPPANRQSFTFMAPVLLNLMADLHIGHPTTDYKRIDTEVETIVRTDNSYVIFAGDLINNMNWNPGQFEEMEQTPRQIDYLRSMLKYLAAEKKLLHHIQGDHDGWLTKGGMDIQQELPAMGVSISNGPTYIHLEVGEQDYDLAGAHQLPGHSIYNNVHPQMRAARFGSMHGADVIFSGHNHKKGIATSYTHELGEPKEVTYLALGPYKSTDSWLAKKGWPSQQTEEMFGVSVRFSAESHEITPDLDIIRANSRHHI